MLSSYRNQLIDFFTNHLARSANQLPSFYIMEILLLNRLEENFVFRTVILTIIKKSIRHKMWII